MTSGQGSQSAVQQPGDGPPARPQPRRSGWQHLAFAGLVLTAATLLRLALGPLLGGTYPFVTYFVAVAVVAWFGRTLAAVFTLVVGGLLAIGLFAPDNAGAAMALVMYLFVAALVVAMGHGMRQSRHRVEHLLAEALLRQNALEQALKAEALAVAERDAQSLATDRLAAASERQRRLYETVLKNTPDFMYVFSLDHKVLYANDALITMWGRGYDGAIGRTFLEIGYEPWHAAMHDREIDQVRASRQPIRGEVPFEGTHGRRHYDYIFVPVIGADGEVEAVAGTTRDITERKEADRAIRAAEERLRTALTAARMVAWEWTPGDGTLQVSEQAADVFGLPAGIGLTGIEQGLALLHPDDVATYRATYQRAIDTQGSYLIRYRLIRPDDGRTVWIEERGQAVADGPDNATRLFGVAADVTDRHEAEQRERQLLQDAATADAKFRSLFDQGSLFAAIVALDGTVLEVNRLALQACGFHQDQVIGKMFWDGPWWAPSATLVATIRTGCLQALAGEAFRAQLPYFVADGSERVVDLHLLAIRDEGGRVLFLAPTGVDLTDRMHAEQTTRLSEARHAYTVRLADAIRSLSDPLAVQAEACRVLGSWIGANRVVYFDVVGEDYVIEHNYVDGAESVLGRHPMAAFGPEQPNLFRIGRTAQEADVNAHPRRTAEEKAAFAAVQIRSCVGVPLVKDDVFVAGLAVHCTQVREWTPSEIAIIEDTAERTWAAVERARTEAALRQSEERSAFVRRSSGVGFWYCDLPFDVLQWDELVKAHFHLPADATVTIQTFYDRIHPDDREPTRLAIEQSIAGRTPYNVDYRTLDPQTGAMTWVQAIGRTFYGADGSPARFDGVTFDISAQKRIEASLRQSEERRRLALDAAELGAWHIDPDTRTLSTDPRFRIIFSGNTDPLDYEQAFEAVHPEDRQRIRDAVAAATRPDDPVPYAQEYRVIHQDGSVHWVFAKGRANYDLKEPRRLLSFDGTVGDITERKCIEDERERLVGQLRDADRRKDEFLATLAHELRNPLAPILNGLQLIRLAGTTGPVEQARSMMERQLGQMVRLVDDLLDVSRITAGKLELQREPIELKAVISAALETSLPQIEQAGHQITISVPETPIVVDGDPVRLAQVVSNLLTNAAKYTPPGGQLRVSAQQQADATAVITVTDNGIGIPPHMLDAVFGMFAQVDRRLEKTTGGLGIGLSLVKGLVELHGGSIQARSQGPGQGSEFAVYLPQAGRCATEPAATAQREPGGAALPPRLRRILVVDDNTDSADSLGMLLELMGNDVRKAYDGQAGVDAANAFRPDVILCDIGMPKLNGFEAARRIRSEAWARDTQLIALTGWGQAHDRQNSADAGFDHHLVKPVDIAVLMELLAAQKAPAAP